VAVCLVERWRRVSNLSDMGIKTIPAFPGDLLLPSSLRKRLPARHKLAVETPDTFLQGTRGRGFGVIANRKNWFRV
jgi:hypothetical protein